MTVHDCRTFDPHCFRCDLSRQEASPARQPQGDPVNTDHHVHNPCPRCGAPEGENCRPERPIPGTVLCCHIERTDALRTPKETR